MSRCIPLNSLFLSSLLTTAVGAQAVSVRVVDGDGAPLGLTSVVLRPSADTATTIRRLTSADGTFRQPVRVGTYTVVARRVGFRADSATVNTDASGAADITLRLQRIPPVLAAMVVRETPDCSVTAGSADADESLWDEIVKGIEARNLVRQTYRYERRYHRVITQDPSMGRTRERVTDSVEMNDPAKRDSGTRYRAGGYTARTGNTTNIRVFDEGDLTRDSFTQFHCHGAPWRDSVDGSVRVAFAPRQRVRGATQENRVRGVVVMDGATWLMRSVAYEYARDGKPVGRGSVQYSPITVDGTVIAMPVKFLGDLRLTGRFGLGSQVASWTIDQSYDAFTRAGEPAPL
jgi:hypothetical protein